MAGCIIPICKLRYAKSQKRKSVYSFPTDPDLLEKWKREIPMDLKNIENLVRNLPNLIQISS